MKYSYWIYSSPFNRFYVIRTNELEDFWTRRQVEEYLQKSNIDPWGGYKNTECNYKTRREAIRRLKDREGNVKYKTVV